MTNKIVEALKKRIGADDNGDWPPPDFDAGVDYTIALLANVLGIDVDSFSWDAATETHAGDVEAIIGNALAAKFGEDWQNLEKKHAYQVGFTAGEAPMKKLVAALNSLPPDVKAYLRGIG